MFCVLKVGTRPPYYSLYGTQYFLHVYQANTNIQQTPKITIFNFSARCCCEIENCKVLKNLQRIVKLVVKLSVLDFNEN